MTFVIYDRMFESFLRRDGTSTGSIDEALTFPTKRAAKAHPLFYPTTDLVLSEDDAFIEEVVRELE